MKSLNGVAVAALIAAVGAPIAHAQEAVQWRVEDGGNGHWYAVHINTTRITWTESKVLAESRGGHLATLVSSAENEFAFSVCDAPSAWPSWGPPYPSFRLGPWLGGYQDTSAPDYQSPSTGWRWITEEQWTYTNWRSGQPDAGGEHYLAFYCGTSICPTWNNAGQAGDYGDGIRSLVIEWSADCNGDGIVDYGQILDGTFADANENGVPDCCEDGSDCNPADCDSNGISDADEIAAGVPDCNQNGVPDNCDYEGLYVTPQQAPFGAGNFLSHTFTGVELATEDVSVRIEARADLDSVAEFATLKVDGETIGVFWVVGGQNCPAEAQVFETIIPVGEFNALAKDGELHVVLEASPLVSATECISSLAKVTLQYATDFPDCNGNGLDDFCEIADGTLADCDGNAIPDSCDDAFPDCNGNGLPDSCDIAGGTLTDCNGNGQPDSCEIASWPDLDCDEDGTLDVCQIASNPALDENADGLLDACSFALGDFDLDGQVGGSDLAAMLSLWGIKNPPVGDLTGDGIVGGADLSYLLGNWGPYQGVWGSIIEIAPDPAVVTDPEWRERIIATGLPWRVRDNASQIEMLLVPPGTFMMGCSPSNQYGCSGDENPVHQVTLTQAYYLGRYEVTQAQWTAVMGSNPSQFQGSSAQVPAAEVPLRPVEQVSWNMIQGFETATGLRLPTEAEWEYACRAGTTTAFNNGSNDDATLGTLAWFSSNSGSQTRPVRQKLANALGLHDMHGNVWEWVEDWYGSNYYAQSPAVDPPGPISGPYRVLRGGSWLNFSYGCRASFRGFVGPGVDNDFYGFRAARTP